MREADHKPDEPKDSKPRRGVVHDDRGRPDLYSASQHAFAGQPHLRKHRRRCYITAMMMLAPYLDLETLKVLVEAGEQAIEQPGSEDSKAAIRLLKKLGWRFRPTN